MAPVSTRRFASCAIVAAAEFACVSRSPFLARQPHDKTPGALQRQCAMFQERLRAAPDESGQPQSRCVPVTSRLRGYWRRSDSRSPISTELGNARDRKSRVRRQRLLDPDRLSDAELVVSRLQATVVEQGDLDGRLGCQWPLEQAPTRACAAAASSSVRIATTSLLRCLPAISAGSHIPPSCKNV